MKIDRKMRPQNLSLIQHLIRRDIPVLAKTLFLFYPYKKEQDRHRNQILL
ncbi:MAG: hypothetical protein ACTSPD_12860 [Promethearchaeota archaeon]